jgi:hypothetical protein
VFGEERTPRPRSTLSYYALWSLILGLGTPFFVICLPAALAFGVIALREIRRSRGRLWGTGIALAGMSMAIGWAAALAIIGGP